MSSIPLSPVAPLPHFTTRYFGRDDEQADIARVLLRDDTRLVTLLGPGGIGKTRLAVSVAGRLQARHRVDVVFVDLSASQNRERMLDEIARALHIEEPGEDLVEPITDHLRERSPLLVLDNLEQVDGAAEAISRLLAGAPGVVILATSRIPLRLQAERQYPLRPLIAPDGPFGAYVEELASHPAIALFVDRAGAMRPGFAPTGEELGTIRDICLRVDGLPLAIELAASRIQVFSPGELLSRLDDRLGLLSRGTPDRPERHRTMENTIAWSLDLLDNRERHVLLASATFEGSFSWDAIEAVAGIPRAELPDLLTALVEHSLVRPIPHVAGSTRFRLLQTVRDAGRAIAGGNGCLPEFRERHARFYAGLAAELADGLEGDEQAVWVERGAAEFANLSAAFSWLIGQGAAEDVLAMAGDLWPYWLHAGHFLEGKQHLNRALAMPGPTVAASRAAALNGLGVLSAMTGEYPAALDAFGRAVDLRRELGDRPGVASILNNIGNIASRMGRFGDATPAYEEALVIATDLGNSSMRASILVNTADVAHRTGDLERAVQLTRTALGIRRGIGDELGIALARHNLGVYLSDMGQDEAAMPYLADAAATFEELGNLSMLASCSNSIGAILHDAGDAVASGRTFEEALVLAREIDDSAQVAVALHGLALNAHGAIDLPAATQYLRECMEIHRHLNDPALAIPSIELAATIAHDAGNTSLASRLAAQSGRLRETSGYAARASSPLLGALRRSARSAEIDEDATLAEIIDLVQAFDPGDISFDDILSPAVAPAHDLTPRELEVLRLVADGKTNAEIGAALFISPFTAKTHVANLLGKIGVDSRASAATWALRTGVLT